MFDSMSLVQDFDGQANSPLRFGLTFTFAHILRAPVETGLPRACGEAPTYVDASPPAQAGGRPAEGPPEGDFSRRQDVGKSKPVREGGQMGRSEEGGTF
jgi:hypothetical protein